MNYFFQAIVRIAEFSLYKGVSGITSSKMESKIIFETSSFDGERLDNLPKTGRLHKGNKRNIRYQNMISQKTQSLA